MEHSFFLPAELFVTVSSFLTPGECLPFREVCHGWHHLMGSVYAEHLLEPYASACQSIEDSRYLLSRHQCSNGQPDKEEDVAPGPFSYRPSDALPSSPEMFFLLTPKCRRSLTRYLGCLLRPIPSAAGTNKSDMDTVCARSFFLRAAEAAVISALQTYRTSSKSHRLAVGSAICMCFPADVAKYLSTELLYNTSEGSTSADGLSSYASVVLNPKLPEGGEGWWYDGHYTSQYDMEVLLCRSGSLVMLVISPRQLRLGEDSGSAVRTDGEVMDPIQTAARDALLEKVFSEDDFYQKLIPAASGRQQPGSPSASPKLKKSATWKTKQNEAKEVRLGQLREANELLQPITELSLLARSEDVASLKDVWGTTTEDQMHQLTVSTPEMLNLHRARGAFLAAVTPRDLENLVRWTSPPAVGTAQMQIMVLLFSASSTLTPSWKDVHQFVRDGARCLRCLTETDPLLVDPKRVDAARQLILLHPSTVQPAVLSLRYAPLSSYPSCSVALGGLIPSFLNAVDAFQADRTALDALAHSDRWRTAIIACQILSTIRSATIDRVLAGTTMSDEAKEVSWEALLDEDEATAR